MSGGDLKQKNIISEDLDFLPLFCYCMWIFLWHVYKFVNIYKNNPQWNSNSRLTLVNIENNKYLQRRSKIDLSIRKPKSCYEAISVFITYKKIKDIQERKNCLRLCYGIPRSKLINRLSLFFSQEYLMLLCIKPILWL